MIENLPSYIGFVFGTTTLLTVWLFYQATRSSVTTLTLLIAWLTVQALVGLSGFYTVTNTLPPRFLLLVVPPLLFILGLFLTKPGKEFLDSLDPKMLTYLHTIRVPVELVLFWLFVQGQVPELMTFEGRNFDILSGLTAPFVAYYGYDKQKLSPIALLIWNFICLALLINIVTNAVLSAPFPFQRFAFDQPNVGVLYFPFVWLPGCVVPLVLLAHLVSIRQLLMRKNEKELV